MMPTGSIVLADLYEGARVRFTRGIHGCFACGVEKSVAARSGDFIIWCDQLNDSTAHGCKNLLGEHPGCLEWVDGPW